VYRIGVTAEFSSAHFLDGYGGQCETMHGHNYRVEAVVEAAGLDGTGLGIDFRRLKEILGRVLEALDHRLLNELPPFKGTNPSSENIARHVGESLSAALAATGAPVRLAELRVWETDSAWAAWRPE
jgi:6-pyruvoyltetrahydropterin/6-carboxytetrahydropterin synthase